MSYVAAGGPATPACWDQGPGAHRYKRGSDCSRSSPWHSSSKMLQLMYLKEKAWTEAGRLPCPRSISSLFAAQRLVQGRRKDGVCRISSHLVPSMTPPLQSGTLKHCTFSSSKKILSLEPREILVFFLNYKVAERKQATTFYIYLFHMVPEPAINLCEYYCPIQLNKYFN